MIPGIPNFNLPSGVTIEQKIVNTTNDGKYAIAKSKLQGIKSLIFVKVHTLPNSNSAVIIQIPHGVLIGRVIGEWNTVDTDGKKWYAIKLQKPAGQHTTGSVREDFVTLQDSADKPPVSRPFRPHYPGKPSKPLIEDKSEKAILPEEESPESESDTEERKVEVGSMGTGTIDNVSDLFNFLKGALVISFIAALYPPLYVPVQIGIIAAFVWAIRKRI